MGKEKIVAGKEQEQNPEETEENVLGLDLPLDKASSDKSSLFGKKEEKEEEDEPAPDKPKKKQEKKADGSKEQEEETSEESKSEEEEKEDATPEEIEEPTAEEVAAFTPREKGLYNALKKERKARQDIEAEADFIKLQAKYGAKPAVEKTEKATEEEESTDPLQELLDSKSPEDFITAAELSAALKKQTALQNKDKAKKADATEKLEEKHKQVVEEANVAEKIMQGKHSDYAEAAHYGDQMMQQFKSLQNEFMTIVYKESPLKAAEWLYKLGQTHRDFGNGKFGKSSKENTEREKIKKVITNAEKKKTSAGDSGDKTPARYSNDELKDMDAEELGQILANMPEEQYFKVPRKIRKRALSAM